MLVNPIVQQFYRVLHAKKPHALPFFSGAIRKLLSLDSTKKSHLNFTSTYPSAYYLFSFFTHG